MVTRTISELNFVKGRNPMPTVEIHAESLEAQGYYLGQIVSKALTGFAEKNPRSVATVSLFGTMSVNFHEQSWSEFLIVAGDEKVLKALGTAFSELPRVKSKYSDYIVPSDGRVAFHVQDGRLWEPEDAITWYSTETESGNAPERGETVALDGDIEDDEDLSIEEIERSLAEYSENLEGDDEPALATSQFSKRTGRLNAARADASIATIRQKIEAVFGLPEGSVALCGPDGRALRSDALIKTLRRRWENS